MDNINLSDTTTLKELFDKVDGWGNLPSRSLTAQQSALINLRNSFYFTNEEVKSGGSRISGCFICGTGV